MKKPVLDLRNWPDGLEKTGTYFFIPDQLTYFFQNAQMSQRHFLLLRCYQTFYVFFSLSKPNYCSKYVVKKS